MVLTADRRLGYVVEPRDLSYRPSVDLLFASVAAQLLATLMSPPIASDKQGRQ